MHTLRLLAALTLPLALAACNDPNDDGKLVNDSDGDGLTAEQDCNDEDAAIGAASTYYPDTDRDGHGDAAGGDDFCTQPLGYSDSSDDCDDTNNAVYPGAEDVCDGLDNDCDGVVDGGLESTVYYTDADGDGYGADDNAVTACEQPEGTTPQAGDCNDADAAYNPGALEEDCEDPNDYNCDGSVGYADADGDGFAACNECDDGSAAVNPSATEVCNDLDDDCDSLVDDADDSLDVSTTTTFYADLDGDGFGDPTSPANQCDPGAGWVADNTDCDDLRGDVNPTASEVCNGLDDDCDSLVDDADDSLDASSGSTFYADADADGYGDESTALSACETPSGASAVGGDCDDADAAYNPGALEDDCTDPNDYNCDGSTGFADADGDGFAACEECDDTNAANFPSATEYCDGVDNDCDGTVDEADAADASTWYADADGDTYGGTTATTACDAPAGSVADSSDCNDGNASVNPAATELCNGVDDDCDGSTDEDASADAATWYADSDGDGYGDAASTTESCSAPDGYLADASDCNDLDADINPGESEYCNGVDDDCDGATDEDAAVDAGTWYADTDGDGYGDAASSTVDCTMPAGFVGDATDCDDTESDIYPGATEVCDGLDQDCDGVVDNDAADVSTWYADADGDGYGDASTSTVACDAPAGYTADATDCNDSATTTYPGATELCDDVDNDCDGVADDGVATSTWYADADGDAYGDSSDSVTDCAAPSGYVAASTDCDDADSAINPAATETCDAVDNDCDSSTDEGGVCPCDVETYDGHEYMFCSTAAAWTTAETTCLSYGYDLAAITSSAENIWMVDEAYTRYRGKWWVGFNDRTTEGTWAWTTGESATYTNWASGEPNNSGSNEDCGQLGRYLDYTWNDEPCTSSFYYVCEE